MHIRHGDIAAVGGEMVGDDDAEDILQEAFIELWNHQEQLDSESHCKSFLYRVIYTRALNVIKHRKVTKDYTAAVKDVELEYVMDNPNEYIIPQCLPACRALFIPPPSL